LQAFYIDAHFITAWVQHHNAASLYLLKESMCKSPILNKG